MTTPTKPAPRRWALPAMAIASVALGACSGPRTFTADVDNEAGQPVRARLFEDRENGKDSGRLRIGPGDRDSFSMTSSRGYLVLEVDVIGNAGVPARVQIGPGDSFVKVIDDDMSSDTSINLVVDTLTD